MPEEIKHELMQKTKKDAQLDSTKLKLNFKKDKIIRILGLILPEFSLQCHRAPPVHKELTGNRCKLI